MLRKARSFLRLPWADQALFFGVYGLLGLARLAILTLPFCWISPWLGESVQLAGRSPLLNPGQARAARRAGRLVRMAARYTPWESKCLAQAMVAKFLLVGWRVPYAFYFGVARDPREGMKAHAWVCAGPVYVTGGNGFASYAVVSVYVGDQALS